MKKGLIQYLGRRYKQNTIMFEYVELERLTKIAHTDIGDCFNYL